MDSNFTVQTRHEKKGIIVQGKPIVGKPDPTDIKVDLQGRIDSLKWPQECAVCGGPVQKLDSFVETISINGTGAVKKAAAVSVKKVPYCDVCYPKIKNSKNIAMWQIIFTLLVGIGLSIFTVNYAGNNPITVDIGGGMSLQSIPCGALILISFVIAYGLSWLLIRLPAEFLMKGKIAKPITGKLQDTTAAGIRSINLVLTIPNNNYAAKFDQLNGRQ
jgi:hypothetical protein